MEVAHGRLTDEALETAIRSLAATIDVAFSRLLTLIVEFDDRRLLGGGGPPLLRALARQPAAASRSVPPARSFASGAPCPRYPPSAPPLPKAR